MAKGILNNARKFQSLPGEGGSGGCPGCAERVLESLGETHLLYPLTLPSPGPVTTTIVTDKQTSK